jgi:hypothetical protein
MNNTEFLKKRKMIFVHPVNTIPVEGDDDWSGPAVCKLSAIHFLKDCDWFETFERQTTVEECKQRDGIPCHEGSGRYYLQEAERLDWPICFLPNTAFGNGAERWEEANYFQSSQTYSFLFLNGEDLNIGWQMTTPIFRGSIARVRHFLRPSIYQQKFYDGPQKWDVLLYLKSKSFAMDVIKKRWPNFTLIQNGYFNYEEVKYKAERSRFAIVGSQWDSYGLVGHEIMATGCPALFSDPGMLPGNFWEGKQGLYVGNYSVMGENAKELETAANTVLSWKRRDVWENSMQFSDPNLLKEMWRQALYGELPEHRIKPPPAPKVFCFIQGKYVDRKKAKCIQRDLEKGVYNE